ncbi:hypothetical protein ZIOFF_073594 [Zingiber officinale]|uniref:Uncharacterized protein n=1 Tax=Zingiber officinale TaxID=94328 RepID=A0A8J5EST1_ZINOF|nr:hypothetical protein ZIOFF_073594 [Zingiber officinale]
MRVFRNDLVLSCAVLVVGLDATTVFSSWLRYRASEMFNRSLGNTGFICGFEVRSKRLKYDYNVVLDLGCSKEFHVRLLLFRFLDRFGIVLSPILKHMAIALKRRFHAALCPKPVDPYSRPCRETTELVAIAGAPTEHLPASQASQRTPQLGEICYRCGGTSHRRGMQHEGRKRCFWLFFLLGMFRLASMEMSFDCSSCRVLSAFGWKRILRYTLLEDFTDICLAVEDSCGDLGLDSSCSSSRYHLSAAHDDYITGEDVSLDTTEGLWTE